jgi:hypothetical protein
LQSNARAGIAEGARPAAKLAAPVDDLEVRVVAGPLEWLFAHVAHAVEVGRFVARS